MTISTQEYETLKKDSALLNALEACGVDNWHGYSDARRYLREQQEEGEEYNFFAPAHNRLDKAAAKCGPHADDTASADATQARRESWL